MEERWEEGREDWKNKKVFLVKRIENFNFTFFLLQQIYQPFTSSNIPAIPTYMHGIHTPQILLEICRYGKTYRNFVEPNRKLTKRLIKQGFLYSTLCTDVLGSLAKYIINIGIVINNECLKVHIYEGIY